MTTATLSQAIGAQIRMSLVNPPATLEGVLYTADPLTSLVVVNTKATSAAGNFTIIPMTRIQNLSIVNLPETASADYQTVTAPIAKLDIRALRAREEKAIREIKERDASRGVGVTIEAQEIYDALARTLPIRWHETSMIVSDAVIIASPYGSENCSAPKDKKDALERVRRVLDNEKKKIAARKGAKAVRKGG